MHAISTIIAIILIILIVVALVSMTYMFASSIFTTTASEAEQSINTSTKSFLTNMKIESVSDDKIYIRNVGQTDITDFGLFIEDSPMDYSVDKIPLPPGDVATVTINKIYNEATDSYEIPPGDIKVSSGAVSVSYNNYQGDVCGSIPEIVEQQAFTPFFVPVNGYTVKARACDADGTEDIQGCGIYYKRENDRAYLQTVYKDSISYPEVIYNNTTGDCTFNITTLDIGNVTWSNYLNNVPYQHSLVLDNNYVYVVDRESIAYKFLKEDGSLVMSQDEGTGTIVRGLSIDDEFIYFVDAQSNLTKMRKTDLQLILTVKYSPTDYQFFTTAVDDTGVYWANNQYNISKVNKTDLEQIFWSIDYGLGSVTDMDVDENYLYFASYYSVTSTYNITKLDKNTGSEIWNKKPLPSGTSVKWGLVVDGNNIWTGDNNFILWQIDKITGDVINSTDYGIGVIYEISFDNDFVYFTDNVGNINKVNKTSKEREHFYIGGGTTFGLACEVDYCYAAASSKNVLKPFKDMNSINYKTGDGIISNIDFCDNTDCVSTGEAVYTIP